MDRYLQKSYISQIFSIKTQFKKSLAIKPFQRLHGSKFNMKLGITMHIVEGI